MFYRFSRILPAGLTRSLFLGHVLALATCLHAQEPATPSASGLATGSLDEALQDDHAARLKDFQNQIAGDHDEFEKDTIIYDCIYVQATTLRRVLEEFITSNGMVAASVESDQIIVSDRSSNIALLKSIIQRLDKPVPQILVEARIVELNISSDLEREVDLYYQNIATDPLTGQLAIVDEIGSKLNVGGATPNTGQGGILNSQVWDNGGESFNAFVRYLESSGKAKILSAPNLIIQRGKEGSIVTGEEVPILSQTTSSGGVTTSTEFKSVGIKLSVKPTMIAGTRVRLEVNPEVSTVIDYIEAGGVSNPIIAVRQARTELEVNDGQLISMAGLLQSTERDTERRTPILSQIPILGALFKSDREQSSQTQLIIFLNIKILEFGDETIIRPDQFDERIHQEIERIETQNEIDVPERSFGDDLKKFFDIEPETGAAEQSDAETTSDPAEATQLDDQ
ncbi:type II secretion system protein GspD [Coraliomargarita akajimensis]|uniref:Type II and III secretion system protein n=1 Tax=Coraliomargarita akajimensis (strain DSM 45221 / IAM 15411 / JCM 23193 / KCTC 12865 / 04OKA010-24) TaxID=583355 RepID=D5ERB3_CORAD|nr:secretin N-terminal domain-containing protein [Coraliomargarita akajimensis]ADE55957.1 type II and III secretion system protein [Coraliomargarita akajimensis DSM 45221]